MPQGVMGRGTCSALWSQVAALPRGWCRCALSRCASRARSHTVVCAWTLTSQMHVGFRGAARRVAPAPGRVRRASGGATV